MLKTYRKEQLKHFYRLGFKPTMNKNEHIHIVFVRSIKLWMILSHSLKESITVKWRNFCPLKATLTHKIKKKNHYEKVFELLQCTLSYPSNYCSGFCMLVYFFAKSHHSDLGNKKSCRVKSENLRCFGLRFETCLQCLQTPNISIQKIIPK